jgi:hypothetical protein
MQPELRAETKESASLKGPGAFVNCTGNAIDWTWLSPSCGPHSLNCLIVLMPRKRYELRNAISACVENRWRMLKITPRKRSEFFFKDRMKLNFPYMVLEKRAQEREDCISSITSPNSQGLVQKSPNNCRTYFSEGTRFECRKEWWVRFP